MKIGEFAKACNTKISVLRHYDEQGVLKPLYTDRFTEYRYYDISQRAVFERITALKNVGFTLGEIRAMLSCDDMIEHCFERKKAELERRLYELEKLRQDTGGLKMNNDFKPLTEDINIPFVNDKKVIGKWQTVDNSLIGGRDREVYFLPGGEPYWCFGWSKGKFIYDDGVSRFVNDYRLEDRNGELIMIISFKSQDYPTTGETTAIALRKLDDIPYNKEQIARKDDINKPFINDERVLGRWKAFCFFEREELDPKDFVPYEAPTKGSDNYPDEPYFRQIEFKEGGHVTAVYTDETITGDDKHTWTKGYWLRKFNSCACAYRIVEHGGKEYLLIEWKSGDYRFGGCESSYYVMTRE